MSSRVLQRYIFYVPTYSIRCASVASRFANPLKKKEEVKTTFVQKQGQVVKKKKGEPVAYRKSDLVKTANHHKPLLEPQTKYWIYDRCLNVFHISCLLLFGSLAYVASVECLVRWKMYKFSQKVAQDLADELGMDSVPRKLEQKVHRSPGKLPVEHYIKPKETISV